MKILLIHSNIYLKFQSRPYECLCLFNWVSLIMTYKSEDIGAKDIRQKLLKTTRELRTRKDNQTWQNIAYEFKLKGKKIRMLIFKAYS